MLPRFILLVSTVSLAAISLVACGHGAAVRRSVTPAPQATFSFTPRDAHVGDDVEIIGDHRPDRSVTIYLAPREEGVAFNDQWRSSDLFMIGKATTTDGHFEFVLHAAGELTSKNGDRTIQLDPTEY